MGACWRHMERQCLSAVAGAYRARRVSACLYARVGGGPSGLRVCPLRLLRLGRQLVRLGCLAALEVRGGSLIGYLRYRGHRPGVRLAVCNRGTVLSAGALARVVGQYPGVLWLVGVGGRLCAGVEAVALRQGGCLLGVLSLG